MAEVEVKIVNDLGKPYGALVEAGVSDFEDVLCDVGTATITYDPLTEGVEHLKLVANEIQIWLDGKLRWWGIPKSKQGTPDELSLECESLVAHLRDRIIDDQTFIRTSVDQFDIWRDLILYAQDDAVHAEQLHRALRLGFAPYLPSGVPRSREWKRDEHANILDLVTKEFTSLENGFEWELQIYEDGRRWFMPYYPTVGTIHDDYVLLWEEGGEVGNIDTFKYNETAVNLGTHGYVTGASEGDVKFEENFEDVDASEEYKVRQFVISESDQKDVGVLLERAVQAVNERMQPIKVPEVTIPRYGPDDEDMLDVVKPGDWMRCDVDHGDIQQHGVYRIGKRKWQKADNIALTFIAGVEDAA